ncbi:Rid family hydrolase [Mesorhizobium australicum]|uniref:RidA family protein n=1 Tax=Mesorhizobium australicum TaxID=536018 RepID=UPI00333C0A86
MAAGHRLAILSGQVGMLADGSVPSDRETEAEAMWANVEMALAGAGFSLNTIVKVTMYVVVGTSAAPPSQIRERLLGSHKPASTLLYVSGLARPDLHYEVEVIAALLPETGV